MRRLQTAQANAMNNEFLAPRSLDYDTHIAKCAHGCEAVLAGQETLLASRALIIGAGGLGSPAAMYLAAAGVGHIAIADPDTVEISNLQRQLLHSGNDLGRE